MTELPFIDVRTIQPRERHPRIFAMANGLAVGESFVRGHWRFEVMDLDGHRIDKILVSREPG